MKRLLGILLILVLTLTGCSSEKEDKSFKEQNLFLTNQEMQEIMSEGDYIIVDVRSESEYNKMHIEGAINIPHTMINENIDLDKDKNIFVYCYSGGRSTTAKALLEDLGYKVYNLGAIDSIDLPKV